MHDITPLTDSTRQAYAKGWRKFTEWCAAEGRDPAGGDGETVAEFLYAMNRAGCKPNTLSQWRSAISHHYKTELLGAPNPARSEPVRAALETINRAAARAGRGPRSASAMTPEVLEQVLTVSALRRSGESDERARLRHLEAEATLRLMFDSALRTDEMARAEWGDLSAEPDAKTGHRTLHIPVSKTDQNGDGRYGNVSPPTWAALQAWRAASPTPDGRISTAPSPHSLGARIRRLGDFAGVKLSGHSPRRGVATALGWAGASEHQLKAVGGWSDSKTVGRYVDAPNAARNAVTMLYDEPDTEPEADGPPAAAGFDEGAFRHDLALMIPYVSQLEMAVKLDAPEDHPEVVAVRAAILDLWPMPYPPTDCAREGCPGIVTVSNPSPRDRYCRERCQQLARNARRRKQ